MWRRSRLVPPRRRSIGQGPRRGEGPRARGYFITMEGPEGSGKSSQSRRLVRRLRRAGMRVVLVRDPGSTALGRTLREVLLHAGGALSALEEALLFVGGRVRLVEERIRPALERGAVVVCDRYHDATLAYQGFGGRVNVGWLDRLGRRAIHGLMPDLTVLLDLSVEQGLARLHRSRDRMERKGQAYHRRVRVGYLRLAHRAPTRFVVVPASQSPAQVAQEIKAIVLQRLRQAPTGCRKPPLGSPGPPFMRAGAGRLEASDWRGKGSGETAGSRQHAAYRVFRAPASCRLRPRERAISYR